MATLKELIMTTYNIALPILLGYIVWLLQQQKKTRDANGRGTMVILKRYLRDDHEVYVKKGFVTELERAEYAEMYSAYSDLGGNGVGKVWNTEVMGLPIR